MTRWRSLDFGVAARRPRLDVEDLAALWRVAAVFDKTLAVRATDLTQLASRRVLPDRFSRTLLFERMAGCAPALFTDFPIRAVGPGSGRFSIPTLLERLATGLPRAVRARVRTRDMIEYLSLPKVVKKWQGERSTFGVTDLHYIGSRFDAWIDTSRLNDFNLLPRGTDGFQSQDSLVVSSEGAVTDSHSDDHSGSNHSFTGAKIWLLWDTIEGLENGIEDVERCAVTGQAAFDLPTFLSLDSSRWILIGPGQTMFIPAHLTHKVITLRRYLGLGSFHAGLPGFYDLLTRWRQLPPSWESPPNGDRRRRVSFLAGRAIRKIKYLRTADAAERHRWGVPALMKRMQQDDVNRALPDITASRDPVGPVIETFVRAARRL